LLANTELGGNCLARTNTLAYYGAELITGVISFTLQAPDLRDEDEKKCFSRFERKQKLVKNFLFESLIPKYILEANTERQWVENNPTNIRIFPTNIHIFCLMVLH
jgi:hypothetical protein